MKAHNIGRILHFIRKIGEITRRKQNSMHEVVKKKIISIMMTIMFSVLISIYQLKRPMQKQNTELARNFVTIIRLRFKRQKNKESDFY